MEEGYTNLPTSRLLGSVPAVVPEDKATSTAAQDKASPSNLQLFPQSIGDYHAPGTTSDAEQQNTAGWQGVFRIASYSPYFNVDTDVVVDRIISSVYPMNDFYRKMDGNPDFGMVATYNLLKLQAELKVNSMKSNSLQAQIIYRYGPIWISATLIFVLSAFGDVGTYLIHKRSDPTTTWTFDVNYVDWAACIIFGYTLAVPTAFYFLIQYFGSTTSLIRLWCLWGYSLFIFLPSSMLLVLPVPFFRWIITILAGGPSSWFIAVNLKAHIQGNDMMILVVSATVLQFALALFIKIVFFR